ncbi:MAG: ATP-binding protein [Sedimentisphaerales bacterium]|nr:ATP-binding protein [Sedimentisphaerales bacterium]
MNKYGQKRLEELLDMVKEYGLGKTSLSNSVTTNWIVFTGTYSSGKTTLVKDLAESIDVHFHQEPARVFIEKQLQLGYTNAEIWSDVESTVMPVHKLRVELEYSIDIKELVLLDTAIPDTLPYALLYGINPEEIIKASSFFRYREPVFLVEPLPFESDEIRNLNSQERFALHYLREKIYLTLGYRVVVVPILDRIKRRDFVLQCLHEMPDSL